MDMKEEKIKSCLETMRFLSRTTDEMMYLCDLDTEKIYYADDYAKKFQIPEMEGTEYLLEDIKHMMYSKSGESAAIKLKTFENLPEDVLHQEYYLSTPSGINLKVYTTEKLQCDLEGTPRWIIGHVKDVVVNQNAEELKQIYAESTLVEELKNSIANNFTGFVVYYQPRIDLKTCKIQGVEALLRYQSQNGEMILPQRFMPLLERTGMISQVDKWVLQTALLQCKKWRTYLPELQMHINISMMHMKQKDIWEQILEVLEYLEIPGEILTLELAENIHMKDYQSFNHIFSKLRKKGVRVAIDDFETGYSSLNYLKHIYIDEIAVDRKVITGIESNAYYYRLLGNFIELAHNANIRVCCKGVETEAGLRTLKELHPDVLQGYLFGKPLRVEDFEKTYLFADTELYQEARRKEEKYQALQGREDSLEQEYARYEKMAAILDGMDEIIYVSNQENDEILYLNAAGRKLTDTYDYSGKKCYEIMYGRKTPCEFCQKNHVGKDSYHVWELDSNYLKRHFLVKNKLIQWAGNTAHLTVCIDITEKEIMSKAAASKDPLTGVYNRKAFEEKVREHMCDAKADTESTLILLDLDNFKMINDHFGHIAGDNVLKQIVEALQEVFQKEDLIGRLGGDEFVIFLKDLTEKEIIEKHMKAFQEAFARINDYQATCSMGITNVKKEEFSYIECLNRADIALYRSKGKGKNAYSYEEY